MINEQNKNRMIIIDHVTNPRFKIKKHLLSPYIEKYCKSSSCIDEITLYIKLSNDKVNDVRFNGSACSICVASIDIVIGNIINKTIEKTKEYISNYINMIENKKFNKNTINEGVCMQNVYKVPLRKKCAMLGIMGLMEVL